MPDLGPAVTVIIATYNQARILHYAVRSVLWQTWKDFELLVVGDACTDDSEQVVRSFQDPRVQWHNLETNSGYQSVPNNEALRRARGRYIAYLNHDDIWLPKHLEVLVDCAEQTNADFAYSILEWIVPWGDNYADIPRFPDASRPPECSASLHLRSLISEIGYWKEPQETYSVPRAEYFRRAQFAGKHFEFVPMLTVLKLAASGGDEHCECFRKIQTEPDFEQRELGSLLASAQMQMSRPTSPRRLLGQFGETIRRSLVRRQIDPARLLFWKRRGHHIQAWRRARGLGPIGDQSRWPSARRTPT